MARTRKRTLAVDPWRMAALAAFAVAMGHLEATVVVYIRAIFDVIPSPAQLDAAAMALMPSWVVASEQAREAATIVMLVTLAYLAGRNLWDRVGVFLFAFGIWDIFYYVALKVMIDWPGTFGTMDCLFLIPAPWYAPVWVPILISCGLVAGGAGLMAWQDRLAQVRPRRKSMARTTEPEATEDTTELPQIDPSGD